MAKSKRDQHLDRYEKELRNVMARTLWVTAYADWFDNATPDERRDAGAEGAGPGQDWDEVTPETPPAAHHAARDLAELFGASEKVGRRRPMLTLYELAMHAEYGEPPDMEQLFGTFPPDADIRGTHRVGPQAISWASFASDMVMEALGTGVSWFDDHKEFELAVPDFECHYDGTELIWSGTAAQGWDEGHVHTSYAEHGFDLTDFKPDGFESVLRGLKIKVAPGRKKLVYTGPTGSKMYAWVWKGKDIEIVTGNDPITGEYALGENRRNREKDYASSMGIRGTPARVTKAADLIRQFARSIKGENSIELEYINFGDGGPPELRKNAGNRQRTAGDIDITDEVRILDTGQVGEVVEGGQGFVYVVIPGADTRRVPTNAVELVRRGPRGNPVGRFSTKGERMYQDIKAEYEAKGEPRAAEIAARTVYARARTVSGLLNVGQGPPPGVPRHNSCGGR
jgi:hypothetical protein